MNLEFCKASELSGLTTHGQKCCKNSSVTTQPTCHAHVNTACLYSPNCWGEDCLFRVRFLRQHTGRCKVGRPGHECPANGGTANCSARIVEPRKNRQCFCSTVTQGAGNTFSHKRHSPAKKQQPQAVTFPAFRQAMNCRNEILSLVNTQAWSLHWPRAPVL